MQKKLTTKRKKLKWILSEKENYLKRNKWKDCFWNSFLKACLHDVLSQDDNVEHMSPLMVYCV